MGLLAGVFYPNDGEVYSFSNKFGYIGATPLIFNSTLYDNIMYGNDLEVEDNHIIEILKTLQTFKENQNYDLKNIISNKTLSSGQMQKIAFVRALVSKPDILLLDEATANLDESSKEAIFDILTNQRITIINSTHDPDRFKNVDLNLKIDIKNEKRIVLEKKLT